MISLAETLGFATEWAAAGTVNVRLGGRCLYDHPVKRHEPKISSTRTACIILSAYYYPPAVDVFTERMVRSVADAY
jgi:hypothetical protein